MSVGGVNPSLPPRPADADLQLGFLTSLEKLLGVLSDSKRLSARITELKTSLEENERSYSHARQQWVDTNALKAEADRQISHARMAFDVQIRDEKAAWDAEEARRREAVVKDEALVAKLKAEAKANADAAAAARQQYEQKLAKLNALAVA
jgi:hypothetical protein